MFLNCDIVEVMLNHTTYFEGSSANYSKKSILGYKLIEHSYDLLNNANDLFLSDVISNLRRAINYRVSTLFTNLGIDNLIFNDLGDKKKLEKLEQLNLVKPLLIKKLITIRNGIEYDGNSPPNQVECEELIDIVWYFYKSTDRFCNIIPDNYIIEFDDDSFLELEFDFCHHKSLKLRGRVLSSYLSEKNKTNSIEIHNCTVKNISQLDTNINIKEVPIIYFTGELYVSELQNYLDIFSIALSDWGNL